MRTRAHYEKLFAAYPDVVTLPEFQAMLGGIGDSTARKIMRANMIGRIRLSVTVKLQFCRLAMGMDFREIYHAERQV